MKSWWRVKISYDGEGEFNRPRETFAFFGTRKEAITKAKQQLGGYWDACAGKIESIKKMDAAPYFAWRR